MCATSCLRNRASTTQNMVDLSILRIHCVIRKFLPSGFLAESRGAGTLQALEQKPLVSGEIRFANTVDQSDDNHG